MTTRTPALATETIHATHWPRFGLAVVAALVPAAALAPTYQALVLPAIVTRAISEGSTGYWFAFQMLAATFVAMTAFGLFLWTQRAGGGLFKRALYQFTAFEHGVELRDAKGALVGETADGSLKVSVTNVQNKRGMVGAAQLVHRGGTMVVTANPSVAPTPGLPARYSADEWCSLPIDMYQRLLRFAS